jgi:hypothetical protein
MVDNRSQPRLGKHGGVRTKSEQGDNVTLKMRGNSREYIIARLARDNRTDLIEAIMDRRISAFAASVVAGYAKRPRSLSDGDHNKSRRLAHEVEQVENEAKKKQPFDPRALIA